MKTRSLSAIIAALIFVAFAITTCKGSGEEIDKNVKVTGVELNKTSLTLAEGASETLIATVSPDDATNIKVTWSSSEPSVATVNGGTVTAIKAGSAVITVKTTDGGKTATCNVTVTPPAPVFTAVTGITGVPTAATAGTALTLTGTVEPSGATNKTITWSVASAGTTGATITGNTLNTTTAGTVTVKATIVNGATATTNYTKDFNITVNAAFVAVTGITGVPTSATAGTALTLTGTVNPSNATNKTITWSVASAGTTGATISGSILNTTAAGTVSVRATITNGKTATTNYTQDFSITVAAASFFSGKGTSAEPYLITNAADLAKMRDLINDGTAPYANEDIYFRQTANINLGASPHNSGEGWSPIGTSSSYPFKGTYDGGGYQIAGLTIKRNAKLQGLFGYIYRTGVVRYIALTGVNINVSSGDQFCGGVAGYLSFGKIEFCYVSGNIITNSTSDTGGVVGESYKGTVENCYSTCSVTSDGMYVGGIAGHCSGVMRNCYATGAIRGSTVVGGVIGSILTTANSDVTNNVAINSSVKCTSTSYYNVARFVSSKYVNSGYTLTLSNYARATGMIVQYNYNVSAGTGVNATINAGLTTEDGANASASEYNSTSSNTFWRNLGFQVGTTLGTWTTPAGRLPYLSGFSVEQNPTAP